MSPDLIHCKINPFYTAVCL